MNADFLTYNALDSACTVECHSGLSIDRIKAIRTKLESKIKIDSNSGCWLWTASLTGKGYGGLSPVYPERHAHRMSWLVYKGPIPKDLCVCHKCDIKRCINPEHLFLATDMENRADAISKGIWSHQGITHCRQGHELTPENTYLYKGRKRCCRICNNLRGKAFRRRQNGQ